jgi:putrescine:ornithine antiporter
VAVFAGTAPAVAQRAPAPGATLARIKQTSRIALGYRVDAFAFKDESGNAAGYSVALCQKVADAIKAELALAQLKVEWVPVTAADRFTALQQGKVDLLCGSDTETLERRRDAAFSIPIFPGGIGALVRADASAKLKDVLNGHRSTEPNWRASAGQLLQTQIFTVISGTTAEPWLTRSLNSFKLTAKVAPVTGYDAGLQQVLNRKATCSSATRHLLSRERSPSAGS